MMKKLALFALCLLLVCAAAVGVCAEEGSDVVYHIDYRNQRDFKAEDALNHSYVADKYEVPTHASKGPAGDPVMVGTETLTEAHVFEDGMCKYCKYACPHENWSGTGGTQVWVDQKDGTCALVKVIGVNKVCPDCGYEWTEDIVYDEPGTAPHSYENGKCLDCGAVCQHANVSTVTGGWITDGDAVYADEKNHTLHLKRETYNVCDVCGMKFDVVSTEIHDAMTYHQYDENNVCIACGYKTECTHQNVETESHRSITGVEQADDTNHKLTYITVSVMRCQDCGKQMSDYQQGEPETALEAHIFGQDGVCVQCGAKNTCTHSNVEKDGEEWADEKIEYYDEKCHKHSWHRYDHYVCATCGQHIEDRDMGDFSDLEHHYYVDGVCESCGYKNTCAHGETVQRDVQLDAVWKKIDDKTHTITVTYQKNTYCLICGICLNEGDTYTVITNGNHEYVYGGACECGYTASTADPETCKHENQETFDSEWVRDLEVVDAKTHRQICHVDRITVCVDCGTELKREEQPNRVDVEEHYFVDGVCRCGAENTCKHPTKDTELDGYFMDAKPLNATEHTARYERWDILVCAACGEELGVTNYRIEEVTEPHEYSDGVCALCGYEQPATPVPYIPEVITTPAPTTRPATRNATTATVTAAPTEAPAEVVNIQFTEDTAVETLRGVDLANDVPAAEAIEALGESLEEEAKQGAVIEIVNLDLVLEADEMDALEELPVKEQLLVMLFAIGPTDFVDQDTALSEQAAQLVQSITERVSKMTAAEKKAFEDLIALTFPAETIVIDGVAYDFFVIDVEIKDGDTDKVERYGFRKDDDGQWILTQLNLGVLA